MEATSKPKFVYVTYITTTPEKLWEASGAAPETADKKSRIQRPT